MQMLEQAKFEKESSKYSECSICFKHFEQDEVVKIIPNCCHIFHE